MEEKYITVTVTGNDEIDVKVIDKNELPKDEKVYNMENLSELLGDNTECKEKSK